MKYEEMSSLQTSTTNPQHLEMEKIKLRKKVSEKLLSQLVANVGILFNVRYNESATEDAKEARPLNAPPHSPLVIKSIKVKASIEIDECTPTFNPLQLPSHVTATIYVSNKDLIGILAKRFANKLKFWK